MSRGADGEERGSRPSRRQRLKPLELVAMAAMLGVFSGGIALLGSRSIDVALVLAGIAFIAALLVLAMLALVADDPAAPDEDDPRPMLERERPERRRPPED